MKLTSHTDYALRALVYLAVHPERTVSTREMAEAYGVSPHHMTKVAKSLTKGGWLLAARGAGGGLTLAPHTLGSGLGDIVRHMESHCEIAECFDPKTNSCVIARVCRLKPVLFRARAAFFAVLDSTTVADIAANSKELAPVFSPKSVARRQASVGKNSARG